MAGRLGCSLNCKWNGEWKEGVCAQARRPRLGLASPLRLHHPIILTWAPCAWRTAGFIGTGDWVLQDKAKEKPSDYAFWFWNWAFAAASTTILSGSIAERATFHSYLIYSTFMVRAMGCLDGAHAPLCM